MSILLVLFVGGLATLSRQNFGSAFQTMFLISNAVQLNFCQKSYLCKGFLSFLYLTQFVVIIVFLGHNTNHY